MMSNRVLMVLGHPSTDSICGALVHAYVEAVKHAGHDVRLLRLGAFQFDAVLHGGYNQVQRLEPDAGPDRYNLGWAPRVCLSDLVGGFRP